MENDTCKTAVIFRPDSTRGDAKWDEEYQEARDEMKEEGYVVFYDTGWDAAAKEVYGSKYGLLRLSQRFRMLTDVAVAVFMTPFSNDLGMEVLCNACKRFGVEIMYYEVN